MTRLKIHRSFRITLCVLLLVLAFPATIAQAAISSVSQNVVAADPLSSATVNLYCKLKSGRKMFTVSGSGVFVSVRGVILTNAHVAQFFLLADGEHGFSGDCSVRTGSPAHKSYKASILYIPNIWLEKNAPKISEKEHKSTGEYDFALLYVTDTASKDPLPPQFPSLPVQALLAPTMQLPVVIAGYPTEGQSAGNLKLMVASSTLRTTLDTQRSRLPDILSLTSSPIARAGVSGGPIVDSEERMIGIVTGKSSDPVNPTLRGISFSYIARMVYQDTALSFSTLLQGDLVAIGAKTSASIPPYLVDTLASGVRDMK